MLPKIAQGLPIPQQSHTSPMERITTFLKATPGLLILDNMEHLLAGGREIVRNLLTEAGECPV